jgi:hypothetical protein
MTGTIAAGVVTDERVDEWGETVAREGRTLS